MIVVVVFSIYMYFGRNGLRVLKKILTFVIIPNFQNACKFKKSVNSLEAR